jgi:hypothetical protein
VYSLIILYIYVLDFTTCSNSQIVFFKGLNITQASSLINVLNELGPQSVQVDYHNYKYSAIHLPYGFFFYTLTTNVNLSLNISGGDLSIYPFFFSILSQQKVLYVLKKISYHAFHMQLTYMEYIECNQLIFSNQ